MFAMLLFQLLSYILLSLQLISYLFGQNITIHPEFKFCKVLPFGTFPFVQN